MKAVVFHRPKHVSVDSVPDPKIEQPSDAIVRVTSTAICGSDLHIYNGLFPQLKPLIMGHEFMGIVEEVGSDVSNLKRGDRVVVPFPIACGACWFCEHGLPPHCERSNPKHYGPDGDVLAQKGGGLFGCTDLYGGYAGGQAQYVRVPFANYGPRKVPSSLDDEDVLFLSDIVPAGYSAIKWAGLRGGETVAVMGCGPVGIMAQKCAWLLGAGRVIGLDRERYRLEMARRTANSETIDVTRGDPIEAVRAMTGGRGADVVVDAVGMEAHRSVLKRLSNVVHLQLGSTAALEASLRAVRRGGSVSVVGVYGALYDNFPLGRIFDKGLRLFFGQAPVHEYIDDLMRLIVEGKLRARDVITHRMSLENAPTGYEIFNAKKDGCVKVVLKP